MSILLDQLLTTADEFDPLGFVVRGVLPVVAAPPGRPALQQGQRLLRRLLFARHVRHKTFEVFYKNIRTTLLFCLVLGNIPPVGSRGLVPRASISRDLPLSTTWGRAGSGLVAPCEVGKWLLPHLPDMYTSVATLYQNLLYRIKIICTCPFYEMSTGFQSFIHYLASLVETFAAVHASLFSVMPSISLLSDLSIPLCCPSILFFRSSLPLLLSISP